MHDEQFLGRAKQGNRDWRKIALALVVGLLATRFAIFELATKFDPVVSNGGSIWGHISSLQSEIMSILTMLAGICFGLLGLGMLVTGLWLLRPRKRATMVNYHIVADGLRVFTGPDTPDWFSSDMHITLPPAVPVGEDFIPWVRMLGISAGSRQGEAIIWCSPATQGSASDDEKPAMTIYPINGSLRSVSGARLFDRLSQILAARGATLEAFTAACAARQAGLETNPLGKQQSPRP